MTLQWFTRVEMSQRELLIAGLLVVSFASGVWIAATTPSTSIPIGIAPTHGNSMTPTYGPTGIAVYGPGALAPGDVVVFRDENNTQAYVMHRVVRNTDHGFVTKGDALTITDQAMGRSYVTPETRVGEVYLIIDSKGIHLPAW